MPEQEVKSYKIEKTATQENAVSQENGITPGGTLETTLKSGGESQTPGDGKGGQTIVESPAISLPLESGLPLPSAAPMSTPSFALDGADQAEANVVSYNPVGRIDPFEPLFQMKSGKGSDSSGRQLTIRDTRKAKLTPLENLDISQLKLTAIILGPQRSIAMVQESTGKGHVIKKGTYIGINSGRVVDIRQNEVIIEEEVEDLLGKIIVRKRELKLQKPLGEM